LIQEHFDSTVNDFRSASLRTATKLFQTLKKLGIDPCGKVLFRNNLPWHSEKHIPTVAQIFNPAHSCHTQKSVLQTEHGDVIYNRFGRDTEADPDKGVYVMTPHDFRIGDVVYEVRIVRGQRYRWELVEEDGSKIILLDREYLRPWRMVEALVDCIDGITHRHPALRRGRTIDSRMAEVLA